MRPRSGALISIRRRQSPRGKRALEAEPEAHGIAAVGAAHDEAHDVGRALGELGLGGEDGRVAVGGG